MTLKLNTSRLWYYAPKPSSRTTADLNTRLLINRARAAVNVFANFTKKNVLNKKKCAI